jgi:hypothetical protein
MVATEAERSWERTDPGAQPGSEAARCLIWVNASLARGSWYRERSLRWLVGNRLSPGADGRVPETGCRRPQASRWTSCGEKAGTQTATYSAPWEDGVLYWTHWPL